MAVKLDTQSFIEKARKVHGDKYDYSKVYYSDSLTKVKIICPIHGEFEQIPSGHLSGKGCLSCGVIQKAISKTSTKEIFIDKARKVHGDKYDYSKVVYTNGRCKVIIICPVHGEFEQMPESHLSGNGCIKCVHEKLSKDRRHLSYDFIDKARKVHSDKYDYSKVEYGRNGRCKVKIICPIHGEFEQEPQNHLTGFGCPLCGNISCGELQKSTKEEFVEKAYQVHGDKYDYSKVAYINSKTKVIIICPIHGEFEQVPSNHLNGDGCPNCSNRVSNGEQEVIDFIKSLTSENILTSSRPEFMDNKELDIYIPKLQLAIEYNGLHYHSELYRDKYYHLDKTISCDKADVHLIHIFEDEWLKKNEIVKSRLRNLMGISQHKIYARKCEIIDLTNSRDVVHQFLNENHIQGSFTGFEKSFGLFYGEKDEIKELVSVMTFNKLREIIGVSSSNEYEYELSRFCSKLDYNVIGGASRLLKHFIKLFNPQIIISYADRRWSYSKSNVYEKLGFYNKTISDVGYQYIINGERKHRLSFTKSKLIEKYGCSPEDTEHNFCFNHGIYRIYDCGTISYKMIIL